MPLKKKSAGSRAKEAGHPALARRNRLRIGAHSLIALQKQLPRNFFVAFPMRGSHYSRN